MTNVAMSQFSPQLSPTSYFQFYDLDKQTKLPEHLVCEHETHPYRRATRAVTFSSPTAGATKAELVPSMQLPHKALPIIGNASGHRKF